VSGNKAELSCGGGIYAEKKLTMTNSTVSGNNAKGEGGGICSSDELTLTSSTVNKNTAINGDGGGIYTRGSGTLSMTNSTVNKNTANNGDGGGIYSECYWSSTGTLSMTNSTVHSNTAKNGAGVYSKKIPVIVNESQVYFNYAYKNGGGILVSNPRDEGQILFVDESQVYENRATVGGGIFVIMEKSSMSIQYLNIINSSINRNTAIKGGGAYMSGTYLSLQMSLMEGNVGRTCGYWWDDICLWWDDPSPSNQGGALYLESSTVIIRNCSLFSNKAGSGGAVSVQGFSILNFTGDSNAIDSNSATNGGAVEVNKSTLNMEYVRLGGNVATLGGAIYGNESTVRIMNAAVGENNATSGADPNLCLIFPPVQI